MELAFSPEQQELVRTVRAFTKKELAPHAALIALSLTARCWRATST
jgi:hypothetical protein